MTVVYQTPSNQHDIVANTITTGAQGEPVGVCGRHALVDFATCWRNYGVHQEFRAPRTQPTKIYALFSGHNRGVWCVELISPGVIK